jgi:hypothetical protein
MRKAYLWASSLRRIIFSLSTLFICICKVYCPSFTTSGLNLSSSGGSKISLTCLTTLTSLAFISATCLLCALSASSSCPRPSFSARASYAFIFSRHVSLVLPKILCILASTFWHAFARGSSSAGISSGDRQLGLVDRSIDEEFWTASMSRGTVRAANMSPVPEKKNGSNGVSILNKRGL